MRLGLIAIALFCMPIGRVTAAAADLSPVADFVGSRVEVLLRPVDVYHWFATSPGDPTWSGAALDPRSPAAPAYVSGGIESYWSSRAQRHEAATFFGNGLYAAIDPVSTRIFGGLRDDTWVLVRIRLEPGFRIVSLAERGNEPLPASVRSALAGAGCSAHGIALNLSLLFDPWPFGADCARRISAAIRAGARPDGFLYAYDAFSFRTCAERPNHDVAWVITSDRAIRPDQIRAFNSSSIGERDERVRIQSMSYFAESDRKLGPPRRPPYPTTIRRDSPPLSQFMNYLWPDLEGVSTDSNIAAWMRENLYACSAPTPYLGPVHPETVR